MSKLSKITRIIWKSLAFFLLFLVLFITLLFFVFQTEVFQTWAAKKATNYLSNELGTRIEISKLKITFVKNVTLTNVFVGDKHKDTLLYGQSIRVNLSDFNYKLHKINFKETELKNIKVKLLKYKNEPDFNFQFLANYFSSGSKKDTSSSPWNIVYGNLLLNNVDFTYHLLRDTDIVVRNMNFNNIHVFHVFGKVSDVDFKEDTIYAQFTNLRATEQCGMQLKNLTTKVTVSPVFLKCDSLYLKTPNSLIKGNLSFNYNTWEDYLDFINKVYIKGSLRDSTILNLKDVAYFSEDINDFNESFAIKGNIRGYVNDLSGSDMEVKYRNNTEFKGDISITGLPDINKSYIHFDAQKLSTHVFDLQKFPLPPYNKPTYLELPKELIKLGVVNYKGKFDGFINDFVTYGIFKTDIGNIKTDIQLSNKTKDITYSGSFSTTNFDFSKLFTTSQSVGPISLSTKINGKGFTLKELDTKFDGNIQAFTYNKYTYQNLKIDGQFKHKIFKGELASRDTNANFDFNGAIDFNNKVPKMDFISTIDHFDLQKTNLSTPQLNGSFSSQVFINLSGNSIDNITGQINFDNTIYKSTEKIYNISLFNLILEQEQAIKNIKLNSSIVDVQLSGRYKLSTLSSAFEQYLNEYFPTFINSTSNFIYSDKADINIKVKNFKIVKELFTKDLMISNNATVKGSFDASINYLQLKSNSDSINYAGIKFKNNIIDINSLPSGISFSYLANSINLTDSLAFKNPSFKFIANDKTSNFNIAWNNNINPRNEGDISGKVNFKNTSADIFFNSVKFVITDSVWKLARSKPITIDTAFFISMDSIAISNRNQLITFNGKLTDKNSDKFEMVLQNLSLKQFNPFLSNINIALDGTLNGNTSIYGAFGKKILNSNISFTQLKMNNKLIGNGELNSNYDPEKDIVNVNGYSAFASDFAGNLMKNIEFYGNYYPKKKDDNLDITFKAQPLDLSLIQPFLKDIFTFKIGYLNGGGKITGTPDKPLITANLKIFKCVMIVDFLNVQYSVSGSVDITPTQINFDNFELRDKVGNSGTLDGRIFHNNFKDIRIDFDVNTNKLMLLNTTSANNQSYYGTAYASGNVGIYGFLDDIKMELNMKTNGGTYFYIPLDGPSEIGNNDFIRFLSKDTVKKVIQQTPSNFSLDFNLEATPDAEVQLIFDEKSGDVIRARGAGSLSMKINSKGKFDMFGNYELTTGDYLFTLENFVTKKFEIQKGSSIKWNGNVYNANIDITAIYRQRASIRPIYPSDSSGKRYNVECKLYMRDKLTSPEITFGIDLPTLDETSRSAISSILSDETELNRQVFSLLLLRSFITPISASGGGGITAGGAVASTGSEMLSNKLSNWLNGVTKEVDVGVNYRPGSGLSSDELDLTLNKQLFNNRLVFDGNFGVANNSTGSTNSSNLIGDVTLEYKLTESGKYRVKGFNRSNDNTQVINNGGPFTQGVGIFYREEYENLNELYKRYLSKFKKKDKAGN